jgi:hypothetical protein
MKKLRLELDALEVESFEVARTGSSTGTVHGHNTKTQCHTSPDRTCAGYPTCGPFTACDTVCNYTQTCETECEQTCFSCDTCGAPTCVVGYITCAAGCTA